jgi:hypothetical protein
MDGSNAVWPTLMCGSVHCDAGRIAFIVLAILLLIAFPERADAQRHRDPCRLLSDAEVRAVQGHAPAQKLPSEQPAGSFRFTQCFYRTPEYTNSVSVAVGIPLEEDGKRSGPKQYWQQQFHPQVSARPGRKKKEPPKTVAGLGDEAFWVGDPMTGALYVLKGEVFLRLSVGGPPDQAVKIKRARALASHALKRLDASGHKDAQKAQ